eukprot:gb/GECG01003150.1/.p1 GENE.gb/GECG01003150.1/~~gb/GECG01003150.1/.p1  ORF type:complete len:477 (+),score=22.67 gb/GECG01003150.1/:1-1431(+)
MTPTDRNSRCISTVLLGIAMLAVLLILFLRYQNPLPVAKRSPTLQTSEMVTPSNNKTPTADLQSEDKPGKSRPPKNDSKKTQLKYRLPRGAECREFRRYLERKLYSSNATIDETVEKHDNETEFKIHVSKVFQRHVWTIRIPQCGRYVFKLSCRPKLSRWRGRQAWPEIVASILDRDILRFNLTFPAYGLPLPMSLLDKTKIMDKRCSRKYGEDKIQIAMGAMTPFASFKSNQIKWYNKKCNAASPNFLDQLFRLVLFDYLVLNTDRDSPKNWFRKGEDIVAMDNGAWAMHGSKAMCKPNATLVLFEKMKVLQNRKSKCKWIKKSPKPICTLVRQIRNSTAVHNLLSTSPATWRNLLQSRLERDLWFQWSPFLFSRKKVKPILDRDLISCADSLRAAGTTNATTISEKHLASFVSREIALYKSPGDGTWLSKQWVGCPSGSSRRKVRNDSRDPVSAIPASATSPWSTFNLGLKSWR